MVVGGCQGNDFESIYEETKGLREHFSVFLNFVRMAI